MKNIKKIYNFTAIVIIVLLAVFAYLFFMRETSPKNESTTQQTEENSEDKFQTNETQKPETSDWKTYRNEEYGFDVKYPTDIFQLDKNTNKLSHTLKNFPQYF